ncbi:glutamate--cysteine ligase [Rhodococcus sp. ACT016]|uniref:glutamate--cysteine ligase n=1 Tax=Rhodococcus sp. ACT016 TaxID=3134808 RepID=UPI003D2DA731
MSTSEVRKLGVEEEFHLIDAKTRRLVTRAPELLERLPRDVYVEELQRCVVEVNSGVFPDLIDLRADLTRRRRVLVDTAAELGVGVVAAGAVPLSVPAEMAVTETPRYRRMLADYQLLAREQLICGTQVHVDVADRDEAVRIANRVVPYLPVFLALSASSPFWADGTDTGYASMRTLVWSRWPTTGPAAPVHSAAEYDRLIADLVASGVINGPGMVYFDLRPSDRYPTLELRVCDSCPSVDTIAFVAGVFRALVEREAVALREGRPPLQLSPTLLRAAMWRAARSGLEGDLVDVEAAAPRPASRVVEGLIRSLRPHLEFTGDWDVVSKLADVSLQVGSSAARQRRTLRRRGRLTDVVDLLAAETAGRLDPVAYIDGTVTNLLHGYAPSPTGVIEDEYDEAVDPAHGVRPEYRPILGPATRIGADGLDRIRSSVQRWESDYGMIPAGGTRGVMDPLPRRIGRDRWSRLVPGLEQRALALNAFLVDVYGDRAAIRDGVVPEELLDRAPGFRTVGTAANGHPVRAHICGVDLVATDPDRFLVLEDNLRIPSGSGYAMTYREMTNRFFPELHVPPDVVGVDAVPEMLRDTLRAAAPAASGAEVSAVLATSGPEDAAWFEHRLLAERARLPLARARDLSVTDDVLYLHSGGERRRVDVLYARMEEDMLLSSSGHDGRRLRAGVLGALRAGTLTVVNALGNGVADDKAVYGYVPALIEYYLGAKPLLEQVPTWVCAERAQRDEVLDRLGELVVKPIDGLDGNGITVGPEISQRDLEQRRLELLAGPQRFVAQEVVELSTLPTFDGTGLYPRHVDLRAFVHLRADGDRVRAHVVPAALTRVAPAGSSITNSSRGGGGKDTWIVTGPHDADTDPGDGR